MTSNTNALELLQAVDKADSSDSLLDAVEALADACLEEAAPTLIAVLSYNNPGAAVAAVDGLVQLGEVAVLPLLNLIDDYNYGGRAWAIRALAGIGDPRALETLLQAAEGDFAMSVRRAAARGLGNLHWSKMLPSEVNPAQKRVFKTLQVSSQDPEWVVRYATAVALQGLGSSVRVTQPDLVGEIKAELEQMLKTDTDLTVRTRVQLAMKQLEDVTVVAN